MTHIYLYIYIWRHKNIVNYMYLCAKLEEDLQRPIVINNYTCLAAWPRKDAN